MRATSDRLIIRIGALLLVAVTQRNLKEVFSLHKIPFLLDRGKKKKKNRMKRWVELIKLKRAKREPSKTLVVKPEASSECCCNLRSCFFWLF